MLMKISSFLLFTYITFFILPLLISSIEPNQWNTFLNLTACRLGDTNPSIHTLKKYFHRFGYISKSSNFTNKFDKNLERAIQTYQQNFNLNAIGFLDLSTIKQILSPRCGVADIINGTSSMASGKIRGHSLFEFFPGNPKWPQSKRLLTYSIAPNSHISISLEVIRKVFARAFDRWSEVTTLTFKETSGKADIKIGFYSGEHGDGEPFDGALKTLAHAFSPRDGRFHLDADENWVADGDVTLSSSSDAVDLESVAVHEIGHLLGLGHSSVEEAIMFPTIRTRTRKVELAKDDVEGVQKLYGSKVSRGKGGESDEGSNEELGTSGARDGGLRSFGWAGAIPIVFAGIVTGI